MSDLAGLMNNVRGPDRPELSLGGKMSDLFSSITEGITNAVGHIKSSFSVVGKAIKSAFGPIGVLMDVFNALGIAEPIMNIFSAFLSLIGVAFMPVVTQIIQMLTPFLPTIQQLAIAFQPLISIILNLILPLGLLETVLPVINTALMALTDAMNALNWDGISQWFKDLPGKIVEWLAEKIDALGDWFKSLPQRIADWIEENAQAIWDAIKALFGL